MHAALAALILAVVMIIFVATPLADLRVEENPLGVWMIAVVFSAFAWICITHGWLWQFKRRGKR